MFKFGTYQQAWLLAYDIRDSKRLQRIHRLAASLGISLNYSVFYLELFPAQMEQLLLRLRRLIDRQVDEVRLYPCCPLRQMQLMGKFLPSGIRLFSQGTSEFATNTLFMDSDHADGEEDLILPVNEDNFMPLHRANNGLASGLWFG